MNDFLKRNVKQRGNGLKKGRKRRRTNGLEDRKEGKEGHEEGVRRHGMQESFSRVHIYKQHAHGEPEAAAKKKSALL
ncbi:MAG: hypothetical protein IKD25_01550 [Bacteroidaceae bacterium]|nr:hypothetical protein [Bacteroidaceae bacterium]